MIELKFRLLLLVVAWACSSDWVQCSESNFNPLEDCKKQCRSSITPTENPTEINSQRSGPSCLKKCLSLAEENANATTHSTSGPLSVTTPSSTERPKFACPTDYGPTPGEILPGEVSDFDVAFVQKKKENSQDWVVHLNWTTPQAVSVSSKWRGYLVIWFSDGSESNTGELGHGKCKSLPKNQPYLEINQTDGWKYPDSIYITIVALPTKKESFKMEQYDPKREDWISSGRYGPTITLNKGHKSFHLTFTVRVILLGVAGILLGFGLMWILHFWSGKRKSFAAYKVKFPSEKKAGNNGDEMKDQLLV